jgi:hypothetical protein
MTSDTFDSRVYWFRFDLVTHRSLDYKLRRFGHSINTLNHATIRTLRPAITAAYTALTLLASNKA